MITRRALISGASAALIAGPSIVRAQSLMPIRPLVWEPPMIWGPQDFEPGRFQHFGQWYADGSYFNETTDLVNRVSSVEINITGSGNFRNPRCSLEAAESASRALANTIKRRVPWPTNIAQFVEKATPIETDYSSSPTA